MREASDAPGEGAALKAALRARTPHPARVLRTGSPPSPARGEGIRARGAPVREITKDAIFHYVYGVLHDPIYREKYALNLKREFPRIPFYVDFWKWAGWGEALMKLHIGYEEVEPWPLERIDTPDEKSRKAGLAPKAMLKPDKESGNIRLDGETQLTGVPEAAWTYRLGNRSALDSILDQYKEKTPKRPDHHVDGQRCGLKFSARFRKLRPSRGAARSAKSRGCAGCMAKVAGAKEKALRASDLKDGSVHVAELHWYEASGIGRKDKIKRLL